MTGPSFSRTSLTLPWGLQDLASAVTAEVVHQGRDPIIAEPLAGCFDEASSSAASSREPPRW